MAGPNQNDSIEIRDVWNENLKEEMKLIGEIVDNFPYVAIDTEFPGTLQRENTPKSRRYEYHSLVFSVNKTKLIQLGLTFFDNNGNLPTCYTTGKQLVWQFNFSDFDPAKDNQVLASITFLRKCGIKFDKNLKHGVNAIDFAVVLMSSGVVMNDNIHWISFHGAYDFAYLLKTLRGEDLPSSRKRFDELIGAFFPVVYDIKHMMESKMLHGGLEAVALALGVSRIGTPHLAGSDSLLTSRVFLFF